MSFKRSHYGLALKQEVTVHTERCSIRTAGCNSIFLKQKLLVESKLKSTLWIFWFLFFGLFFLKKRTCFTRLRKEAIMFYN